MVPKSVYYSPHFPSACKWVETKSEWATLISSGDSDSFEFEFTVSNKKGICGMTDFPVAQPYLIVLQNRDIFHLRSCNHIFSFAV